MQFDLSEPEISMGAPLFLAFLGGLVLNLMPCVFPVLSIKALGSLKMAGHSRGEAASHGFAYTSGILLTFVLMAGVLILLKQAGSMAGWGFHLQNPVVVVLLSWLLFVTGMNLSGFFELQPGFGGGNGLLKLAGGPLARSFATGMLAAIVATPCTAPFMGVATGYALTLDAPQALAVFAALGLGLAFPYLILSLSPGLHKFLPRPGAWMQTLQQFLAFPLYASGAWLVWVLSQQAGPRGVATALFGMVAIAFAIWLLRQRPEDHGGKRIVLNVLSVCALMPVCAMLFTLAPSGTGAAVEDEISGEAVTWSQERLSSLLAGDRPVFVEMGAAWCITCKVNHKVALDAPQTRRIFTDNNVAYLYGDWTNRDNGITAYLESHGRSGVPLYVYYGGREESGGKRPAPEILPQILTPAIIRDTVAAGP